MVEDYNTFTFADVDAITDEESLFTNEFELMPTTTTSALVETTTSTTSTSTATIVSSTIIEKISTTTKKAYTSTSTVAVVSSTLTNSTKPAKQQQKVFHYAKGNGYENVNYQQLWKQSKLFEQKLASTRLNLNPTSTSPTTTTTPRYNLRTLSTAALAVTFNLNRANRTANFKEINKLAQSLSNSNNNESLNETNGFANNHGRTFEGSIVQTTCNCSKATSNAFFDEYTNVWKLSFFVLAFVIGFVSLFLLLSLIFRVMIMHLRKYNIFGSRTYKLQNAKSTAESSKVSSISLFEADSDNYLSCDRRKGKDRKGKRKSKSRRTARRNASKVKLKSERILYGVSNKAFAETPTSKFAKEHKEYMLPFDMTSSNGLFSSFVKEDNHSSFRPFAKTSSSNASALNRNDGSCVISMSNIDIKSNPKITDIKEVTIIKREEYPTYQPPWKQCNDYEALETTTATGSVTNLSSITSLSEALNKQNGAYLQQHFHCSSKQQPQQEKPQNNNNNEVISRCSKITEELELKLKERRMLTEGMTSDEKEQLQSINDKQQQCDKHHYINESTPVHQCSCPCRCHHENNKKKQHGQNNPKQQKNNRKQSHLNNKHQMTTTTTTSITHHHHHRQIVNSPEVNTTQTTDENNSPAPAKRESIRKLRENKAVSENKQKQELEKHLTSMLISRINSCEVLD